MFGIDPNIKAATQAAGLEPLTKLLIKSGMTPANAKSIAMQQIYGTQPPQEYQAIPKSNTMLYVGAGVLGLGLFYFLTRGK